MKTRNVLGIIAAAVVAVIFVVWLFGAYNPGTPAGYVGYVTRGAVFGETRFYGMQSGPTSPGRGWMLRVQNVSITPYTYNEPMEVLSKDNMKVKFQIHIVWRVKPDHPSVKTFIEKFSTLVGGDEKDPNKVVNVAYDNFLKEPLRTAARNETQALDAMVLKEKIIPIGKDIHDKMLAWVEGSPFDIMSVVVGDIQYPESVANAVSDKLAATQILQKKQVEIDQARMDAEKRVVEAGGIAKSMEIIQAKLTPQYLTHEAIEAQKAMVNSPNHSTIYIPVGPMGVPLVGNLNLTGNNNK